MACLTVVSDCGQVCGKERWLTADRRISLDLLLQLMLWLSQVFLDFRFCCVMLMHVSIYASSQPCCDQIANPFKCVCTPEHSMVPSWTHPLRALSVVI